MGKLELRADGVTVKSGWRRKSMTWSDVDEIYAVSLDLVTYDEDFLVLQAGEEWVEMGELDDGFADVEHALFEAIPSLTKQWRAVLQDAETDMRKQVWRRPD